MKDITRRLFIPGVAKVTFSPLIRKTKMINSVRVRLTLWYVAVFGLLLAAFSALIYGVLAQNLYARLDRSVKETAGLVVGEFQSEIGENGGAVAVSAEQALSELQIRGVFLAIFDDQGNLLASNPDWNQLPAISDSSFRSGGTEPQLLTLNGPDDAGVRVAVVSLSSGGRPYLIIVGESLRQVIEQLRSIRRTFYVGFPASLLVAAIGGFLLARKSLAPVVAMANQANRISAHNLNERLTVGKHNDELQQLARVFNDLLSRLHESFENMRGFVADASHELRTPLAIIRGEADVALSEDREPVEYRDALAIIQDEARRVSLIVDDMMALARADAGQGQLRIEDFYLNDLIEECCKAASVLTVTKGVSLTTVPMSDITFRGDQDLLRRMLLNLLDNAIKYTPRGGSVSVEVECEQAAVRIRVTDTGIGIAAAHAQHVFDRFYRVDRARSRADGGTGLGLAIAKWVAEAHNGWIELASEPGQGSTFTVSLPR
jgi:heavy metal sensor kinase